MAKMTLEQLVEQLKLAFGAELVAVVLYGSAAREDAAGVNGRDRNVLVVVEHLTMDMLAKEAAVAASWAEAGHPAPVTMTASEWRGSADVFPIEYADLLESHKVLHGRLPTEGVAVRGADLRLQLEHETLGKLFRLRRAILRAGREPKQQLALLSESVGSFVVLLRALLRAYGDAPPKAEEAAVTAAAQRAGIDAAPFLRALRHARGVERIAGAEAQGVLEAYLDGVTKLVHHIDRMGAP